MSHGFYDPGTGGLLPGETVYSEAHEWAHVRQHARNTIAWRLWRRTRGWWGVSRPARVLVEIEAAALATAELRACGIWQRTDGAEALRGLAGYMRALFV